MVQIKDINGRILWENKALDTLAGANLQGANLQGAYLKGAYLQEAYLKEANLQEAYLPNFQIVPEKGPFIAYKKVRNDVILELEILGDRTSSLVGRKCRTNKVKVLSSSNDKVTHCSNHDPNFIYTVGEIVKCPDYNPDIRLECTKGIHFFITRKEAEDF